ncbi:Glycosyltransferase involved in cell wall bisynthesis [Andreprevotia lacus DSM 23236]|jgi:glycosyltransferase involved in cell wall biosynthesis|uniref:Glycosyltransferase involved in cell wall bisynthesis n=1 Tax=Andreprevotia lacus DSM 23236 TaxID=1121001 RepID=A0A1W1XGF3_9NEIS|nr:glycosyltransferase family 4 protein [Andreprevotia lacus]SMC23063.1 Glycosyltransferase involved in cell wall bisynthesis [Andreprevotia lacus DSM 23236]
MKVAIVGLRGFPDVQGGVERHVESLAPLLAEQGAQVTVYVRAPYMKHVAGDEYRGVRFCRVWSPTGKASETLVHTFLSVLAAAWQRNKVIHFHAIGPSFFVPLARLLGMHVVMTHHGQDYQRQKWGKGARWFLRTAEKFGVRWANHVVVISHQLKRLVNETFQREAALIPNGVTGFPDGSGDAALLADMGLEPGRYVLNVGRFVPEKRHHDLIDAFLRKPPTGWKLVFAGAADHEDSYSRTVLARTSEQVVFLGRKNANELASLYGHCGLFVLPSSHEGLPIALLEALSLGAPSVVSDIEPHLELDLPAESYFPLGDIGALADRITHFVQQPARWDDWAARVQRDYHWPSVAQRIHTLYQTR